MPSGATDVEQSAVDEIDQSYEIPVTNPGDHVKLPSVLLVTSATLDTRNPDGSGTDAPQGMIYLSLQASSGPAQLQFENPQWGHFFSGMTPIAAAALRYVTATGRSYAVTRIDPINQTYNPNSAEDNGLFDATYYFTVPITNRSGTLVIEPNRTVGVEYVGSVGGANVPLVVGGPTRIALTFPKNLTVVTTGATGTAKKTPVASAATFASLFNFVSTLIVVALAAFVHLNLRRWRRRRVRFARPVHVVRETPPTNTATRTPRAEGPVSTPPVVRAPSESERVASTVIVRDEPTRAANADRPSSPIDTPALRVDVLGPLKLSPTYSPPGESVKAIVTFLALHNDRVLTLGEIQTAIWPLVDGANDIKRPVMLNYMADARKVVGEQHLPTASGRSGYRLVDVSSDWAQFQQLIKDAATASKNEALALRQRALRLVRGVPFAGENSRYFTWALTPTVTYNIIDTVTALAHDVAKQSVLSGDLLGADDALRQGLLCDPTSLVLWEDLTDIVLESADTSRRHFHWRAAEQVLGPKDVEALRARELG